jgi:hypothetical protein
MKREGASMKPASLLACREKTPDGSSCRARPLANSGYCFFHDPKKLRDRKLASQRGGKGKVTVMPRPNLPSTLLRTNEQILTFVEAIIADLRGGAISPKAANAVGYLLNVRLHALPVENAAPEVDGRSENVKAIMAQIVENSIYKAQMYELELPEDLKALAEQMTASDSNRLLPG